MDSTDRNQILKKDQPGSPTETANKIPLFLTYIQIL